MTPLVEPVGKKLAKARETRGLTLEEAGLETRIRASQLAALEADDYAVFPNNTYARGFLLIYGKFLGVDVREVARGLEGGNPISMGLEEYQYLNAFPEAEPLRNAPRRSESRREDVSVRRPSLVPLIVFVLLLGAVGLGIHLYIQASRLETTESQNASTKIENVEPRTAGTASPAPTSTAPVNPTTTSIISPKSTPQPFTSNAATNADRAFLNAPANVLPTAPNPAPVAPVAQTPMTAPTTPVPLPPVNELVVEPLKKTHVTIRRDDPNAEPIFDDVLYPKVGALRLKGARFFIQITEPDAVTLRKNGQSVAYQPGSVIVP